MSDEIKMGPNLIGEPAPPNPRREHDDKAKALAAAFVRGEIPEQQRQELMDRENIQVLYDALTTLAQDIDTQFAERKAKAQEFQGECLQRGDYWGKQEWFRYKREYDSWRAGARRFKQSIDASKREVRAHLARLKKEAREASRGPDGESGNMVRRQNHLLRTALAIVFETYELPASFVLLREEVEADDAPYVELTPMEEEDGWYIEVIRRQKG